MTRFLLQSKKWILNLPIRRKLLYGYLLTFFLVMVIGNTTLYFFVRSIINSNVESELKNSSVIVQKLVETSQNNLVTSYLRGVAEKNLEIVTEIFYQNLTESEAKERARLVLSAQKIGESGLIYVINSQGVIQAHPQKELIGKYLSEYDHIRQQQPKKQGYITYTPENIQGGTPRKKAVYMSYFGPWDWIISVSAYRDEFRSLLDIKELRSAVLSLKFGGSGYSYVMDAKGKLLIHPKLEGTNIFEIEDSGGNKFIQEICRRKNGKIIYHWKNTDEDKVRKKYAFFKHIPELDWIVVSNSYLDEFFAPLKKLRFFAIASLIFMVILVVSLSWQVSKSITKPLKYLMNGLKAASKGDFSKRLIPSSGDELGQVEAYFNTFVSQLQISNKKLNKSEQDFRSLIENAVEGIFQFDIQGNILKVNPSFVAMLGYQSGQALLEDDVNFLENIIVHKEQSGKILDAIISDGAIKGLELQVYRKSGAICWCLLNARGMVEKSRDEVIRIEGFISDISDKKSAQESQKKMIADMEAMVSDRTAELSQRINELEQRNMLNSLMGEMADMLQSCRSIEETFPVISQYLKTFFSEDYCGLYLYDDSKEILDKVIPLKNGSLPVESMTNDDCWALRQGKTYLYTDMDSELTCDHLNREEAPHGYMCIPLMAHSVTIGLLHIVFKDVGNGGSSEPEEFFERKTRLCSRLAEHLSLALANLKLQEELKRKSIQDSLTGLANRRHMEEILRRQFFRMMRYNTPCSLIMLDVDYFKKFNDTYGHDMGDHVLKELGTYLKDTTRGEDLACRFGGEEFIVILVDTTTDLARKKAEKIRREVAELISIPHFSERLHITVSVGVATSPTHGRNMTELLKSADDALYRAKANGRNRVEVAAMDSSIEQDLEEEAEG